MLKLPAVFSDGALFLHSSPFTVSGECDFNEVSLSLKSSSGLIGVYSAPVSSGRFEITFVTPAASFTKYEIEISSGDDKYTFTNILFGELFLASGQSNMEWPTRYMPFCENVYEAICGKEVRIYYGKPKENGELMPRSPERYHQGSWEAVTDVPSYADASALSVAFAISLYEYFQKEKREVPVGVLSLSVGGVPIEAYLIEEDIRKDPSVLAYINEKQIMPDDERWNTLGARNRELPTSLYNYLIAPVLGVRARGMLWYQGESNVGCEYNGRPVYAALLEHLHRSYKKRFAPVSDEAFPIFCSQIFPWCYSQDEEKSCMCYAVNNEILSLSKKRPDEFYTVPIADLNMRWSFFMGNHPIHPSNKFVLGRRFCDVVSAAITEERALSAIPRI